MEYSRELKERVGLSLQTAPHGSQKLIAGTLKVTTRTLRSWRKQSQFKVKKVRGRKKIEVSFKEKLIVTREWKRQGYPGVRPIKKALPEVRLRVTRELIGELKMRRKKRKEKIKITMRKSVKVHKACVVMAMDGATVRKRGDDYIVHRDRGSLSVNVKKCEGNLTSKDTLGVLKDLEDKNRLPLVFCTDNGSPFCSDDVEDFLNKKYIVHLKNLPKTPQHNGSCENAVRDFKELFEYEGDLKNTTQKLNYNRKRKTLNWQTSHEFEQQNIYLCTEEKRKDFYLKTKQRLENASIGINSAYKKRKIERDEILNMMQELSLITITGGNQTSQIKAEEIA
jgi:transposase InsO family protein